jgi:hypothetical protein
MSTITTFGTYGAARYPDVFTIATNMTGNTDSNTLDRAGVIDMPAMLSITTTVGGTPTTKVDIKGSADGTNWYNVPYALVATPETWVNAQITITSATTNFYIVKANCPWRYLKITTSVNTNVTITDAKVTVF